MSGPVPPVDQFLSDIGAGALSTAVVLPSESPGADGPAAQLFRKIDDEISATNDRTLALLKDNWDDFAGQLKQGDELISKLEDEAKELKLLEQEVDGPNAFLPALVAQLEDQKTLADAHKAATASVSLLTALVNFHTITSTLASATTSGSLDAAVEALAHVTSAVEEGADDWIEKTDLWRALVRWASEEESRLESMLQGALEACFELSSTSLGERTAALTMRERVTAAPNGPELSLDKLLQSLEDLAGITGRPPQIEAFLARLAKQVLRFFVAPFLDAQGAVNVGPDEPDITKKAPVMFRFRQKDFEHVVELVHTDKRIDPVAALSEFLAFFTSHSSLFPPIGSSDKPSKHAATLTAHLTPSLQSFIISSHLSPSLPASTSSLEAYLALVSAASTFESTFLPAHGLFAFLPSALSPSSSEVEEQRVIRTWAARVPQHWARHVGDRALARVRGAVKAWDWGAGETVEVEVREEDEMLGLLLGLGLAGEQSVAAMGASPGLTAGQQGAPRVPRELVLQTVPRGAQREMTIEEALAPKVPRAKTPPPEKGTALEPAAPTSNRDGAQPPPLATASTLGKGTLKRGKLGAARIAAPLPPRSPSPPPLFQGDDAPAPDPVAPHSASAQRSAGPQVIESVEASPAPEPHALDRASVISPVLSPRGEHTTFELLEDPAPTVGGIETTADHAGESEVGAMHSYEAQVKDEEEDPLEPGLTAERLQAEQDEPRVKSNGADRDELAQGEDVSLASNGAEIAAGDELDAERRVVKEESVEPEIPPTPSPGLTGLRTSYSPGLQRPHEESVPELDGDQIADLIDHSPTHEEDVYAKEDSALGAQITTVPETAPNADFDAGHVMSAPRSDTHVTAHSDESMPDEYVESAHTSETKGQYHREASDDLQSRHHASDPDPYAPPTSAQHEYMAADQAEELAHEAYGVAQFEASRPYIDEQSTLDFHPTAEDNTGGPAPDGRYSSFETGHEHDQPQLDDGNYWDYRQGEFLAVPPVQQPLHSRDNPSDEVQQGAGAEYESTEYEQDAHAPQGGMHDPHASGMGGNDPYASAGSAELSQAATYSSTLAPDLEMEDPYADEAEHDWYADEEHDWYAKEDQAFSPLEQPEPSYQVAQAEHQPPSTEPHETGVDDTYAPAQTGYGEHAHFAASEGTPAFAGSADSATDPYAPAEPDHDPYAPVESATEAFPAHQYVPPQQLDESRYDSNAYAPQEHSSDASAAPQGLVPPPPPSALSSGEANVMPPPPRAGGTVPPPRPTGRSGGKRRPVYAAQYDVGPPSSASDAVAPLTTPFQQSGEPPRTIISPPPAERQQAYAPLNPPSRSSSAPHNASTHTLSARTSNTNLARSIPSRPTSAQRNDGPVLNHIQQRFASPPPQMASPYIPLSVPPPATVGAAGTYLPANDPMLADLFGSSTNKTTRSANFFAPDPQPVLSAPQGAYGQPRQYEEPYGYGYHGEPQQQPYHHQQGAYTGHDGAMYEGQQYQESYAQPAYEQQQYAPYGYEQPAMRMRGGGDSTCDVSDSDEDVSGDAHEPPVLRLRGGADLGDMDEDDGNRSADDWGFGDDAGGEEDAWGFDDGDEAAPPPTPPSPAPAKQAVPSALSSQRLPAAAVATAPPPPVHPAPALSRPSHHIASASIASVASSTGSTGRSRPPSYAYTPALNLQTISSSFSDNGGVEGETVDAGGDAWGFEEEEVGIAPSPPSQVENVAEVDVPVVDTAAQPPMASPSPVAQSDIHFEAPETASDRDLDPAVGGEDEWGFSVEDGEANGPEPSLASDVGFEPPNAQLDYEMAVERAEEVRHSPPPPLIADEVVSEEQAPSVSVQNISMTHVDRKVEEDAEAEADGTEGDDWGLEEPTAGEQPEPAYEDESSSSAPLSTILNPLRDGNADQAVPVNQREPTVVDEVLPGASAESALATVEVDTAPAGPEADAALEVNPAALQTAGDQPYSTATEDSSTGQPDKGRLVSVEVDQTEPSALNLPADEINQNFPSALKRPDPVLPRLPEPLPHHDEEEASARGPAEEAALLDTAVASIDDAAQVFDGDAPDDEWGLGSADDISGPDELATLDKFGGEARDEAHQEEDLPVASALIDPQPVNFEDDFVDFSAPVEAKEEPAPPAWEPFEDPGNEHITSPPLDAQTSVSHHDEDLDALSPVSRAVPLPDLAQLVGDDSNTRGGTATEETAHSSTTTTDPALVDLVRQGSMSSPEVIEHADAWDDGGQKDGAEVLADSPVGSDTADGTAGESTVQHVLERPVPRDDSAVQHEAERPLVHADSGHIILPAEDAHPQQRTFSPPPSMLPAGDPDGDAGWDWQDGAGAEALLDPHGEVTAEGPVPVAGDSTVQHEAERPDTSEQNHDRAAADLDAETPAEDMVGGHSHVPLQTQEDPLPTNEDNAGAELLHDEPALDIEEGAQPLEDESTVQHINARPVLPAHLNLESEQGVTGAHEEHAVSQPVAADSHGVPYVPGHPDDDTVDDPWDLEPVEPETPPPHPVQMDEGPSAADVLDAHTGAYGSSTPAAAVAVRDSHAPVSEADSDDALPPEPYVPTGSTDDDSPVVTSSPEFGAAKPSALSNDGQSSVQQRGDPSNNDSSEVSMAILAQPQQHTFAPPASSLPAEGAAPAPPVDAVEVIEPIPASFDSLSRPAPADDGWGWDGDDEVGTSQPEPATDVPEAVLAVPGANPRPDRSVPEHGNTLANAASRKPEPAAVSAAAAAAPPHMRRVSTAEDWSWGAEETESATKEEQEHPTVAASGRTVSADAVQPESAAPAPAPHRREKMMVSRQSRQVGAIAEEILLEAAKVASPTFQHPDFALAAAPLLQTFISLLSLYRATAAVHNSRLLASVPAIGMQFANDAEWIGREVERVWRTATEHQELPVAPEQANEVRLAIESTRQLGRDTRQKQIAIQRAALMECLDEANGFLRTSDEVRYQACERALQQVMHILQRLALVWKPVMTPTALFTSLGGLINEVLLRMLDEIEEQTDITEEESIRLNKLCKMLHELESLFDGSETSLGREAPAWYKFAFLSELLEASMADILFLFDHGHLVDFTPQEIVRLVRALFADSPLRNRNIEKILRGHPEAPPADEEWAE